MMSLFPWAHCGGRYHNAVRRHHRVQPVRYRDAATDPLLPTEVVEPDLHTPLAHGVEAGREIIVLAAWLANRNPINRNPINLPIDR